jgi:hypothetical protein
MEVYNIGAHRLREKCEITDRDTWTDSDTFNNFNIFKTL